MRYLLWDRRLRDSSSRRTIQGSDWQDMRCGPDAVRAGEGGHRCGRGRSAVLQQGRAMRSLWRMPSRHCEGAFHGYG